MIGKDKKQQALEQLEKFILDPEVKNYFTFLWFSSLRNEYPFQYLQLLKKHRNRNNDPDIVKSFDDRIIAAIYWIENMKSGFNKYIIIPPENEDQKKEFKMLTTRLKELLLKQNKEN
jgi:hypothetical protein